MGILDDAIRQHLDLKRRQGAEEDELQRLEDEAFGPPSRPGDPEFAEASTEGEVAQAVEEPAPADEPVSEPPAGPPQDDDTGEAAAFFDQSDPEAAPSTEEHARPSTDEQMALDSTDEPASEPQEAPVSSLDTVEHPFEEPAEDAGEREVIEEQEEDEVVEGEVTEDEPFEADEGEGDEDVLEETPEFLRDAPEDDELWFEQGEPKDFDF